MGRYRHINRLPTNPTAPADATGCKVLGAAIAEARKISANPQWRYGRGVTQAMLAKKVGCSRSAIAMYETGRKAIYWPVLLEIQKALGCTFDGVLLGESLHHFGRFAYAGAEGVTRRSTSNN